MTTKLAALVLGLLLASTAQAAISFVGVEDSMINDSTEDWACDLPNGGVADGHVLIIVMVQNSSAQADNPTNGLVILEDVVAASDSFDTNTVVGYIVASGLSATATITFTNLFDASETGQCVVLEYSGVDTMNPIVANEGAEGAGLTSISGPEIDTTGVDGAMIIQVAGSDPNGTINGTPDSDPVANERYDLNNGFTSYVYAQDYLQPTGGPIALDVTGLASDSYVSVQLALRPAATSSSGLLLRRRRD
jgi:hypothetical protein